MPEVMIAFCPWRVCPRERNNRAADEQNSARCFELREFLKRTSESFNGSRVLRRKRLIHDGIPVGRFCKERSSVAFSLYILMYPSRSFAPCCTDPYAPGTIPSRFSNAS